MSDIPKDILEQIEARAQESGAAIISFIEGAEFGYDLAVKNYADMLALLDIASKRSSYRWSNEGYYTFEDLQNEAKIQLAEKLLSLLKERE